MSQERPLPLVGKLPKRLRMPVYAGLTALAGLAAACGVKGQTETKSPGVTPTAPAAGETFTPTRTPEPSPIILTPTPEPTPDPAFKKARFEEIQKIVDSTPAPTAFDTVKSGVELINQKYPDLVIIYRGFNMDKREVEKLLAGCEPKDGNTNGINVYCEGLAIVNAKGYIDYGSEEFLKVARDTYFFGSTAIKNPNERAAFIRAFQNDLKQLADSLPK